MHYRLKISPANPLTLMLGGYDETSWVASDLSEPRQIFIKILHQTVDRIELGQRPVDFSLYLVVACGSYLNDPGVSKEYELGPQSSRLGASDNAVPQHLPIGRSPILRSRQ